MRRLAGVLRAVWLVCAVVGCGSDGQSRAGGAAGGGMVGTSGGGGLAATGGTPGSPGGTGVTNTAGGTSASGGAGGVAGAGAIDDATARVQACLAYATAVCKRRGVCTGNTDVDCDSGAVQCPDVVFSPGSQRTVQGLVACAKDYESFPCDALARGEVPPCVTPGTRAAGEPCVFPSQCATLSCQANAPGECGKCATRVGRGEACKGVAGVVCASGLLCDDATGQCVPAAVVTPTPTPSPKQPGEACDRGSDTCAGKDYTCTGTDAEPSAYECRPEARLGESCARERDCASDSYCPLALVCAALPALGQPCGVDAWTGTAGWCDANGTCKCSDPPACKTGICTAPAKAGEDCGQGPCAAGLSCHCADATRNACKCVDYQDVGESCGTPNVVCRPWATCTANVCTAVTSQNLFASACGP